MVKGRSAMAMCQIKCIFPIYLITSVKNTGTNDQLQQRQCNSHLKPKNEDLDTTEKLTKIQ